MNIEIPSVIGQFLDQTWPYIVKMTHIFLSQNEDPSDFLDQKVTGPATSQNCLHFCFEITIPV